MGVFADPQGQGGEPLWHTGQLFLRLPLFSWMSQAGLCPGTGPGSRALTLGVTRPPVHPAQQKCTGCSSGFNSSRVGRSPWPHSCHSLFHSLFHTSLFSPLGEEEMRGVSLPLSWDISCGTGLFFSRTDLGFSVGPSPLLLKPFCFLSSWGITFSASLVLSNWANLVLSSGSKTTCRRMLLMGKIKRSYKTVCQCRKCYHLYSPAPAHIHILMHRTEKAERIFSRLFIENFDRGWDHIRHLEFLSHILFC